MIPVLIRLGDGGPIFFVQNRIGRHGRVFRVIKFRTMIVDANEHGPSWTTEKDLRITPVGRILRRTALDELPEVISIWKRDMSLVGPRALDVDEHKSLEKEIPGFRSRLEVTPGLTGMAQIYDRLDVGEDKLRYDLEYIRNMNWLLDVKILFLSVRNTLLSRWDHRQGKYPSVRND